MEAHTNLQHLIVKDIIQSELAITTDDGNLVYDSIHKALNQKNQVKLDFEGINIIITAFLNSAIGRLYEDYNSEFLNSHLILENVANEDKNLFRIVAQRAKEYFADKNAFENSVNNSF